MKIKAFFGTKTLNSYLNLSLLIGFTYPEVCCFSWHFLASAQQKIYKASNLLQSELFFKVPFLALANFLGTP